MKLLPGLLFLAVVLLTESFNVARKAYRMQIKSFEGNEAPMSDQVAANRLLADIGKAVVAFSSGFALVRRADAAERPVITDRVVLNVKIANYTEESIGKNKGAAGSGDIVIGLYGKAAPESVARFLETVVGDAVNTPNYMNAQFARITTLGLLEMDKVRGVNKMTIGGSEQFEFMGNLLTDYKPLLENSGVHHDRRGLLTRKQLTSTPEFSITTLQAPAMSADQVAELDSFHCVFGEVVSGFDVLDAIEQIPQYTYTTSTGYGGKEKGPEARLADKWFQAQREFYVGVGKSFGDTRAVDLRGKLLKRISIKGGIVLPKKK